MHPILASRQRQALYLASWPPVALLLAVAWSTASPAVDLGAALVVVAPPAVVHAFVCLSAWYVCRAMPLTAPSAPPIAVAHAGAGMVAGAVWMLAWEAWTRLLGGCPAFAEPVRDYRAQGAAVFAAGALLFWMSSLFHYLLIAFDASRRAETRELGFKVTAREAELRALRAQIDPHFLFNSLHSISALTTADPPGARRMCLLLADFFRSSVRLGAKDEIRIAEELDMARAYLDIERVRFGARLSAEVVEEPGCGSCLIPPLILQPLVENAVRHGIHSRVGGGLVRVTARGDAAHLHLSVLNPADADADGSAGTGVGLANVRRRLAARFGGEAAVRVVRAPGSFRVDIRIPRRDDPETRTAAPRLRPGSASGFRGAADPREPEP